MRPTHTQGIKRMKKIIFSVAIALVAILLGCASRQQTTYSTSLENALLWRVSGNGLSQPSYLFGTHHLIPVSFLETVPGLTEAFASTLQVVGELDMSNPAAMMELQMLMTQRGMMPEGVTYAQLLSPEDYALLDNTLTSLLGVGLAMLGQMQPTVLSTTISTMKMMQEFPEMTGETSLDLYFQEQAIARSLPVKALDTTESQLHAMFGVASIERQAEALMCMLHHPELAAELIHRMNDLYIAFDIQGLYTLSLEEDANSPCPSTDEERHALTRDRHLRCITRLSAIIQETPSFVAVGALHLPGEYGLIAGLRRAGYTVEAVMR